MSAGRPPPKAWDGAAVRAWLQSRIAAARAEQVAAERAGRDRQDDCDKAAAEEMVCTALRSERTTGDQPAFAAELERLLDQGDYIWRGIYDERRFDRHVRSYLKKLVRMAKANDGFDNLSHYQ